MVHCVAYGCGNRTEKKVPGISFHLFPNDEKLRCLWINAVRRENWVPSPYSRLCSAHFPEDMIDRTSLCERVRLRENAVPVIFQAFPQYLQKKHKPRETKTSKKSIDFQTSQPEEEHPSTSGASANEPVSYEQVAITYSQAMMEELFENGNTDEVTMQNSPDKTFYKRKVQELTEAIESKNKKVKVLHQKVRRYKKKNESLSTLLDDLKEKRLMNDDALEVLKTVSAVNEEFLSRQLASVSDERTPKKYSPKLRSFALTLHFYSPRAYEYVRQTFSLALPHQKTLVKWYQHLNGDPGFTEESFRALHAKIQSTPYTLYFSLVFDEMAIRQHVEFDGKRVHGHIDFGVDKNDDSLPLAKEAFVLLLVCINGHWKLPLGYFLTDGLSSEQKADFVRNCLTLLQSKQCQVVSLTFDGLSANLNMMKQLGCINDCNNIKTTFPHPSDPTVDIAVFLDPSHMLKLVRNTFGEKKSLFSDKMIEWRYIVALHQLQESEGLHLNNKLRAAHVYFAKQKMKVKFAAQLLSNSVADAIEYCNVKLSIPEFKGSEETVKFLRMFNTLFDILNSRSIKHLGFKKAVCKENVEEVLAYLKEADNYISNLKTSDGGEKIISSLLSFENFCYL